MNDVFEENFKMLKSLRDELVRLDIHDSPSKTEYNKMRDKSNSPAASTVLARLDMPWSQVMQVIGLRYDGLSLQKDSEYLADDFTEMNQDQKMDYFIERVRKTGLTNDGWFRILNIVDEGNTINKISAISTREKYVSSDFKKLSHDEQLERLLEYINDNKILNSVDYNIRRDKEKTPSLSYISNNFGGWKNVTEVYTKKYKKEMG